MNHATGNKCDTLKQAAFCRKFGFAYFAQLGCAPRLSISSWQAKLRRATPIDRPEEKNDQGLG
jgi:hypothetical protein